MSETGGGSNEQRRTIIKKDSSGDDIGKITIGPNKKGFGGWLQGLFIREDKRKQGLWGELVDEALTTSSFTEVRTEIAMSNTISVKMHEARGFVLESTKTDKSGNVYGIFIKKK